MVLGTLYAGGSLLAADKLSAGELMAFLVASQSVQKSLAQGSLLLGSVVRGMSAGARVMEVLKLLLAKGENNFEKIMKTVDGRFVRKKTRRIYADIDEDLIY